MIRDSSENQWLHVERMGRFLSREEALADPELPDLWAIIDKIHLEDPVLSVYFNGPTATD